MIVGEANLHIFSVSLVINRMKDGRVILPGGRYHMTYADGTCRLMIDNVTSSDTGVYTCIISNSQGKSSSTASLKLESELQFINNYLCVVMDQIFGSNLFMSRLFHSCYITFLLYKNGVFFYCQTC